MRRLILSFILFIALTQAALAWGPIAHKRFCEEAVETVWGHRGLSCLDDQIAYCLSLKSFLGEDVSNQCLEAYASGIEIHPATMPASLLDDTENHYNYDSCPLKWVRRSSEFICSGEGNPAGDMADVWFDIARQSTDYCTQVRSFCTGGFYYASSLYPLLRVKYLTGCLGEPMSQQVDEKLESGEDVWEIKQQCVFKYMKKMAGVSRETSQHITFILDSEDVGDVASNLTVQADYVRNPELMPERISTSTTSTTTSTTQTTISYIPSTTSTSSTTIKTLTTTSTSTTTTVESTTSTTSSTTTTTTVPEKAVPQELNRSLEEIDSLFDDIVADVQEQQTQTESNPLNLGLLAVLAFVFLASVVMAVYVYSQMRRPSVSSNRRVVLPPSARRRMKKNK